MINFTAVRFDPFLLVQATLAVLGTAVMTYFPHPGSAMLLVPLTSHAARDLPALVLNGKTRLIATGPIKGSFVVVTTDDRAWGTFLLQGVLPLAASASTCGGDVRA